MPEEVIQLRDVLRRASTGELRGDVFLGERTTITLQTPCLVLSSDIDCEVDDRGIPLAAVARGFPNEGLQLETIEDTAQWARQFADPPSDELLLASYLYYFDYDAFLPHPDAPPPPSPDESQAKLDREFYERLGPERAHTPCRKAGCARGAVSLSALCRVHHFESIVGRACPFVD